MRHQGHYHWRRPQDAPHGQFALARRPASSIRGRSRPMPAVKGGDQARPRAIDLRKASWWLRRLPHAAARVLTPGSARRRTAIIGHQFVNPDWKRFNPTNSVTHKKFAFT